LRLAVHRLALNLPVTGKSPWTAIEVCWQLGLAQHLKSDDRRTTGREQGKSDCHHWSEMALLKSEGRSGDGSIPPLTIIKNPCQNHQVTFVLNALKPDGTKVLYPEEWEAPVFLVHSEV
jgi:hypothetical protein